MSEAVLYRVEFIFRSRHCHGGGVKKRGGKGKKTFTIPIGRLVNMDYHSDVVTMSHENGTGRGIFATIIVSFVSSTGNLSNWTVLFGLHQTQNMPHCRSYRKLHSRLSHWDFVRIYFTEKYPKSPFRHISHPGYPNNYKGVMTQGFLVIYVILERIYYRPDGIREDLLNPSPTTQLLPSGEIPKFLIIKIFISPIFSSPNNDNRTPL